MRVGLLLVGMLIGVSAIAQSDNDSFIIPYLCNNGKYAISNAAGVKTSQCIFDSLALSTCGVTFGIKEENFHFIGQNGTVSPPVTDVRFDPFNRINHYTKLAGNHSYYSYVIENKTYIYDQTLNNWHGPLTQKPPNGQYASASYEDYWDIRHSFITFIKGRNSYLLSSSGKALDIAGNNSESFQIKGDYLYVFGQVGESTKIYNSDLNIILEVDSIIMPRNIYENYDIAFNEGKRYRIIKTKSSRTFSNHPSQISLDEIPFSLQWDCSGYTYHENENEKWILDRDDKLYYTLAKDETVLPLNGNIISYKGDQKQFLIGADSIKLRQPHLSFFRFGKKYLFQDIEGFYILNHNGTLYSNDVFKDAHEVTREILWVSNQNGENALLDIDLNTILSTKENIVRSFLERAYVYQVDSLYGLVDSLGNRLTPPISTQSDFYFSPKLEWIRIHRGNKSYLYNILSGQRTTGLRNEFRISDKHFDEEGKHLISSTTYHVDSSYFYRQDGTLYKSLSRDESYHFQRESHRYNRVETSRNNYVFIDRLKSDTLLYCNDCEGMYVIDVEYDGTTVFVICSYKGLRKDLYNIKGQRLLPRGISMQGRVSMNNELAFYPQIIVQRMGKIGIYDVEKQKAVIPLEYDKVHRIHKDRLSLQKQGKSQITDLQGSPINSEYYYRLHVLKNGDVAAQFPIEGTHKKRVYFDANNPDIDPCEGKIVDVPNYYYKIIDKEGRSRFKKKFVRYIYETDNLISVSEMNEKDTIHYCMNINGQKLIETADDVTYLPFYKNIIERKQNQLSTFVTQQLTPLVNREFRTIGRIELNKDETFYCGSDSLATYVYNDKFIQTAKVPGKYDLSRFDKTILLLYNHDSRDVYLLDADGSLLTEEVMQTIGRNHTNCVMTYRKNGKLVYVDLLKAFKFWD